jgi:hypothetical protein
MRLLNLIKQVLLDLVFDKRSIFRVVIAISFLGAFVAPFVKSEELVAKPIRNGDSVKGAEKPPTEFKRINELGGEVLIDGSLRVLEPINGKVFDLVEISTPVTPAANHARIFLRADGSKQTLVILYDDGSTDNIATNQ